MIRSARLALALALTLVACATTPARPPLALAETCAHAMPKAECTVCDPARAAAFKERRDWCAEHELPESHCLACHPALKFYVIPELKPDADLVHLSTMGEDVAALEPHLAPGKITVFDFYAFWCGACKEIDAFMHTAMSTRTDLAYRKINVYEWDSAIAKRWLKDVPELPYVVVFDGRGSKRGEMKGLDLDALARLVEP